MIENQSISEKERMDYQSGPDLLSELPLGIIHIILARVPLRDAVRTSVLSRQWRYAWASLPRLVFNEKCANREDKSQSEFEECLENIITHVLFHHKGPIHEFKVSFFFESICLDFDEWILRLSRNDIKELILELGDPDSLVPQHVHSSIYSCEKLTDLQLDNCEFDPPPSAFKGFLFLRRLLIHGVYLSYSKIESLLANSPLLEYFTLCGLGCSDIRIRAPNLKYLMLSCDLKEMCLYAPLLTEMSVLLSDDYFPSEHQQQKSSVCNYTNFMGGLTNLEKLSGDLYFTKFLSIGIESCHRTVSFHRLKDIELNEVNFEDIKEISVVARLIIGAPNLYKLKISTNYDMRTVDASDSEAPEVSFRDFGCAPNFRLEKLGVVIMKYVTGFRPEVEFLKFFLETSPVLESMYIVHVSTLGTDEKQDFGR